MSDINYGQILEALNDKCDRDMGNSEKPYITETYSSGTSWYRVWSDGWCEQGGYISSLTTNYTQYTLLKEYKDTNYSVVASYAGINGDTANFSSVPAIPAKPYDTEHIIIGMYGNTQSCFWEAKGYIL